MNVRFFSIACALIFSHAPLFCQDYVERRVEKFLPVVSAAWGHTVGTFSVALADGVYTSIARTDAIHQAPGSTMVAIGLGLSSYIVSCFSQIMLLSSMNSEEKKDAIMLTTHKLMPTLMFSGALLAALTPCIYAYIHDGQHDNALRHVTLCLAAATVGMKLIIPASKKIISYLFDEPFHQE